MTGSSRWRSNGVRIIRAGELSSNTPQTPGMQRRAAVTTESAGATKLWAGTVTIEPVEAPELIRWIDDLHK